MKSFFKVIDKNIYSDDAIEERIFRETKVNTQVLYLMVSILVNILSLTIMSYCIHKSDNLPPKPTYELKLNGNKVVSSKEINTLPVPHQSLKNVSGWLLNALNTIYGVGFDNIDKKIDEASYYFTEKGYQEYLKAIEISGFRNDVVNKKLKITLLPVQNPVIINSGIVEDLEFWRLRVPVLITYIGGKEPVKNQKMVEVLIIRVPSYQNKKGLAISEFIIGQ